MKLLQSSRQPNKPKVWQWKPLLIRSIIGSSMLPGLKPGSIVIGSTYHRSPHIGQIIILNHQGLETIKRITKLSSDDQKIYVLGDNLSASTDSRDYGWLPTSVIVATVVWPFNRSSTNRD